MTHDVFICHSSKDRTIANAICSTLEQHHIRCWIAPRDVLPGSDYAGSIIEAINGSRLTVLVFSSRSNESAHVRREIERTVSHGIPVLPFRVEEVVPSLALEYFISDAHWLDAMTPPLEEHLGHLVGTVQLLLERQAAAVARASEVSPTALPTVAVPVASLPPTAMPPTATPPVAAPPAVAPATVAPMPAQTWGGTVPIPSTAPARGKPSTPVLAAIGAAVLVVLAVGAFLLGGGGRPGPSQATALQSGSSAPSQAAALPSGSRASGSRAPASGSRTPASGSPRPTLAPGTAVDRITAALPASLSCDAPETPSTGSAELASVFCFVGDGTVAYVTYSLYPSVAALRKDYGAWLDYYGLAMGTPGTCSTGERKEDIWTFESTPSITEGHYFCVVDDSNEANVYWTDEVSLILVDLSGDTDATLAQLYALWRDSAYDPVRP